MDWRGSPQGEIVLRWFVQSFVPSYVVLFFSCGHSPPIGSLQGVPVMNAASMYDTEERKLDTRSHVEEVFHLRLK